jgi:hypothetical protein
MAKDKKREFGSLMEMKEFFREAGRRGGKIGGKIAAKKMTKAQRIARAKKASAAASKVRTAKAKAKKKEEKYHRSLQARRGLVVSLRFFRPPHSGIEQVYPEDDCDGSREEPTHGARKGLQRNRG